MCRPQLALLLVLVTCATSCADGEGVTRLDGAVNRDGAIVIDAGSTRDAASLEDAAVEPDVVVMCSGEMNACAMGCCPGLACVMGYCIVPAGCRGTAESCAVTTDCCGDLICVANRCTSAPMCGARGTACSSDASCCMGLSCVMGTCGSPVAMCVGAMCAVDTDCCMGLACVDGGCSEPPVSVACRGGCPTGEYCEYTPNDCGRGAEGVCLPRPSACPDIYAPVCGCNGMTYSNACDAASLGIDVEYSVACGAFDGGMPPSE